MVKDAESHAAEDKKRRETIDAKNHADQLVYSLEKLLRENKDKIPADEAEAVQNEIENTKKAIAVGRPRADPEGHGRPVAGLAQADGDDVPAGRSPGGPGRRDPAPSPAPDRSDCRRRRSRPAAPRATSSTPKSWTTIRRT